MEENGFIEIKVSNRSNTITPKDIDINEVTEFISNIETFLFPTRKQKRNRPKISYDLEEGSAKHLFYLPISAVILFNGLTSEIHKRKNLDFLDSKRQEIIDKFQKKASKKGYIIEFKNSLTNEPTLIIDYSTNFEMVSPTYFESEFYLYGEIYQEGGKSPNIHISTIEYGNITVKATKEQIIEGDKKTYKPYGIKVRGKKSLTDGKLSDLVLLEFIEYKPDFDKSLLEKVIERASKNLGKIKNVDSWLQEINAEVL